MTFFRWVPKRRSTRTGRDRGFLQCRAYTLGFTPSPEWFDGNGTVTGQCQCNDEGMDWQDYELECYVRNISVSVCISLLVQYPAMGLGNILILIIIIIIICIPLPVQYPAMGLGNILIISGLVIAALLAAVVVFIFYRRGSLPCRG